MVSGVSVFEYLTTVNTAQKSLAVAAIGIGGAVAQLASIGSSISPSLHGLTKCLIPFLHLLDRALGPPPHNRITRPKGADDLPHQPEEEGKDRAHFT